MNLQSNSGMRSLAILSVLITMLLFSSCGNKPSKNPTIQPEQIKNDMEKVNKTLVQKENEDIEDYIARHEWKMQSTGTGLRYNIYYKALLLVF